MIQIHVDVDNLWMYEKEFGIKIHPDKEYIYKQSLPLFLNLLKKFHSKVTFMIIGQDLKLPACQVFCRKAIAAGHEIANHTWSHPISFGSMSFEQKKQQISKTHQLITQICGKEPVGFRGSGYYQDEEIISILKKLNYHYDSSILPGFSQLLMSTYAFLKRGENRHKTFGRPNYFICPEQPYRIKGVNNEQLLELPISILPIFRLPIHTTFAYFFGSEYRKLILRYLRSKPDYMLYLFHAIDFVDLPTQDKNHPVIPLQFTFNERMNFIQKILETLVLINGGPLKTSRETIKAIRH
jgi:hypothetical protein